MPDEGLNLAMEIFTLIGLVEAGNISRLSFVCEEILNQICNVIVLV
ncbi:hypothetical protein [Okeania sp. SIO2B3]|nr:hypothetical protein [Okeania sp. SIO2B3]